jgi:hypothetical protein
VVRSHGGHHARGARGGADVDRPPTDKVGEGLHSEHPGDMGDSPCKERRAGSQRRHGGGDEVATSGFGRHVPSQRRLSNGDAHLCRCPTAQEEEGEVSCVPQPRQGRKRAWRRPSPEAGEGSSAPDDFDEDKWFPELGGGQIEASEWGKVACRPLREQATVGKGIWRRAPAAPCAEAERENGG